MGLLPFVNEAGEKPFGKGEGESAQAAAAHVPPADAQRNAAALLSAVTAPVPIEAPKRLASRSARFSFGV
jgi:hypothetical protein